MIRKQIIFINAVFSLGLMVAGFAFGSFLARGAMRWEILVAGIAMMAVGLKGRRR